MAAPGSVGFFGKLPGVGDFVQRRLPTAFVSTWDARFESAVSTARGRLAEAWHAVWQAAPVWRFALMPGVCGVPAWVGVTGPSVDRVGRGFPMVLALPLTDADVFRRIVGRGSGWFGALEHVCRSADALPTAEAFDAAVAALPSPVEWLASGDAGQPDMPDWPGAAVLRLPWKASAEDARLAAWLGVCMDTEDGCLWWTTGGSRVASSALLTHGLPRPQDYAAFLDAALAPGDWYTAGAMDAPAPIGPAQSAAPVSAPALPDDLDDVLSDLLPKTTDAAGPTRTPPDPVAASTLDDLLAPGPHPAPAPAAVDALEPEPLPVGDADDTVVPTAPPPHDAPAAAVAGAAQPLAPASGVELRREGAFTLLAADNGPPDPRRQAAARIAGTLVDPVIPDAAQWRARLLALHAPLRERGEDLINPVPEDGAAVLVHIDGDQATMLRVGAAGAWHWRRGQLRPVFENAPPAVADDEADTARPGDLTGVLNDPRTAPVPGLGSAEVPRCDEVHCLTAPGDRLVLLATDTLMRVPAESLAAALAEGSGEEARARIARDAGLGMDRLQWPVAVIEVGT